MTRTGMGLVGAVIGVALVTTAAQAQQADIADAADHPALARYDGAVIRGYRESEFADYRVLVGPGATDAAHKILGGRVWRIAYGNPDDASIGVVAQHYEDVLADSGFDIVFSCQSEECGGLGFAYAVDTLPLPAMQFDPADYRYIAARRSGDPDIVVGVFISTYNGRVFTQVNLIEVTG